MTRPTKAGRRVQDVLRDNGAKSAGPVGRKRRAALERGLEPLEIDASVNRTVQEILDHVESEVQRVTGMKPHHLKSDGPQTEA